MLIALPFIFYTANSKEVRDHNIVDRLVVFCSRPVQWMVVSSFDVCATVWHRYIALVGVQAQNDALRAANKSLQTALSSGEEERQQNARLRLLVGLRARAPTAQMVFAQVIGTATNPLFRSLRIDRGQRNNIMLGAAVVSHAGVIGRIAALGDDEADVMLLVDNNSSTDVLVQRTRARARVRGQGGDQSMGIDVQYLARTADIAPGDVLITSGLGQTFPKGLRVGTIVQAESRAFGLYQSATVQPSVDFSRIEAVMVLSKNFAEDTTFETSAPPDLSREGPWLAPSSQDCPSSEPQ